MENTKVEGLTITPGVLGSWDESTLADLEIVAGHVWSAVGGVNQNIGPAGVKVMDVDPKRFGVEIAASTSATWVAGEEGDTKQLTLATLRPFKPMDMIISEKLTSSDGVAVTAGLTEVRLVEVNGVNQFTAKNPVPSNCFGTLLSAPRPAIRFDTVQTAPSLTLDIAYVGGTITASASLTAVAIFGGVAVKR